MSLAEFHYTERLYLRSILTPPKWEPKDHPTVGMWYNSGFWIEYEFAKHKIPVAPFLGQLL